MKSNKFLILVLMLAFVAGCSGGSLDTPRTTGTLTSITITPAAPSVAVKTTQQFTATGTFSDNVTEDLTIFPVVWSSSDTSVATISNAACSRENFTAVAPGTTTITATLGGVSSSVTLTVTSATLVSLAVLPATPSVTVGATPQFTATGTFSDTTTQDLTTSVTWSSSDTSVATISNAACSQGNAVAVAPGTTTITAAWEGISSSATLTVTPATLVSIAVLPANPSIDVGGTQPFIATGTFSDTTTQDLTTSVTWSSSDTSIATISNATGSQGNATAVAPGTTTITATLAVTQPASGSISGSTGLTVVAGSGGQINVLPITVNGSLCSSASYLNEPCVSVTICTPGTSTCQTITDILLDTGSYGLRIFKQALSVPLQQVTAGSGSLAECVQFGDGSSEWGPVESGDVILGGEPAAQVPLQVVDAAFGSLPESCANADQSPEDAGFNGILGVGLFAQDCGSDCVSGIVGLYYACSGSACSGTTVPLASQVQNPVALLHQDNNGVLVQLPNVPSGGAASVDGSLVLGIGTRSNNTPSGVTMYPANQEGEFTTTFGTPPSSYTSFIDSGSNGLFFAPSSQLPACPSPNTSWFCPSTTVPLSATTTGASGSPSNAVSFQIGDFDSLINSSNNVFADIGGDLPDQFDWGLPFFFGRNVFVGIDGQRSSLGTGPYWAY